MQESTEEVNRKQKQISNMAKYVNRIEKLKKINRGEGGESHAKVQQHSLTFTSFVLSCRLLRRRTKKKRCTVGKDT